MSNNVKPDWSKIESKLKGNTLRLYWYIVKDGKSVTINKAQRGLSLSSPGLVSYHLNKLVELGLVERVRGEYCLSDGVKVGILRSFVRLYGFMVPRYVFYAVFFSVLSALFLVFFANPFSIQSWFAGVACLISTIIFWVEAYRIWRGKPF